MAEGSGGTPPSRSYFDGAPAIGGSSTARADPLTQDSGWGVEWREGGDHPHPSPLPSRGRGLDLIPPPRGMGIGGGLDWWVLFVEGVGLLVGVGGVEDGGLVQVAT